MAFIFVMSTGLGSAEHTIGLLDKLIHAVMPEAARHFGPVQLEYLNYLLRKLGHVVEYIVLTALAVRALKYGKRSLKPKALFGGLGLAAVYAMTDEAHQYFVPYRTASIKDVLIDCSGAMICAILIAIWFWIKNMERGLLSGRRVAVKS